jgi:lysyl-tRNA synthetase class 1
MSSNWWDQEAASLTKRVEARVGERAILFETGYGPSGLPHLGTFAEVARTAFVRWAFQRAFPGVPSRQLAFSDDMDGLRSVPENVPNRDAVREHLGRPLCRIPDPFGRAESFSGNMISRLREFLGAFGFDTEFLSSSQCYEAGTFDDGLQLLLEREAAVKAIVLPTLQPDTQKTWSPFLPICEQCGRYTTTVIESRPSKGTLVYACNAPFGGATGCGHTGEVSVRGGAVKVGWKVDWALRWFTLGVDYEMYGKDLIESAVVSNKIVRALGGAPPAGSFYELFLDEEGHKISKKIGNGIAFDVWREYSPDDPILFFLTKPPKKARRIGLELVGRAVDEFLSALQVPAEHAEVLEMMGAVAPGIPRPHNWRWQSDFDYGLLVGVISALGIDDPAAIRQFFLAGPTVRTQPEDRAFVEVLLDSGVRYSKALDSARKGAPLTTVPSPEDVAAVGAFAESLRDASFAEPDVLQNAAYEAGKAREIPLRHWFSVLYVALIGAAAGPRLGTLLSMLGRERALAKLQAFVDAPPLGGASS